MHILAILGQCKSSCPNPIDVIKLFASLLTSVLVCANFVADKNGDIQFRILYFGRLYIAKEILKTSGEKIRLRGVVLANSGKM